MGITGLKHPLPPAGALDFSVEVSSLQSLFGSLPIESVEPRYMAKGRACRTPTVSAMKSIPSSMSDKPSLHWCRNASFIVPPWVTSIPFTVLPQCLLPFIILLRLYHYTRSPKMTPFLLLVPMCKVLALWVKDLPFFMPVRSAVHVSYSLQVLLILLILHLEAPGSRLPCHLILLLQAWWQLPLLSLISCSFPLHLVTSVVPPDIWVSSWVCVPQYLDRYVKHLLHKMHNKKCCKLYDSYSNKYICNNHCSSLGVLHLVRWLWGSLCDQCSDRLKHIF